MLTLRSVSSDRQLTVQRAGRDAFEAELTGHPVQASVRAWVEMDLEAFVQFFDQLAQMEKPWVGERKWWSMEGELAISATCSSLGVVLFRITLSGMSGAPEEWSLEAGIESEFGQLANIAQSAKEVAGGGRAV